MLHIYRLKYRNFDVNKIQTRTASFTDVRILVQYRMQQFVIQKILFSFRIPLLFAGVF